MLKVEVSRNSVSTLKSDVDFNDSEWSCLLPENLNNKFQIEELLRPCKSYPEGLYPLSKKLNDKQVSRINRFDNYIEFSRIVDSEIVNVSGQLFLTTKFYDNRKEGWSSKEIKKKVGDTIGYCINGDVYCAEDKQCVYKVFYINVYKLLIAKKEPFKELISMLKRDIELTLISDDIDFLKYFKDILLSCVA